MAESQGLRKLPDELLLNIFHRIHIESQNPRSERGFQASSTSIRDIALVCSTFLPIAREVLYAEPVIYAWPPTALTPVLLFTRTLLERPEIGKNVRNLHVQLPILGVGQRGVEYFEINVRSQKSKLFFHVDALAREYIRSLGLTGFLEDMWLATLRSHYPPFADRITPDHGEVNEDQPTNCLGDLFGAPGKAEFEQLLTHFAHRGAFQQLKNLQVIGGPLSKALDLDLFPQISALELNLTCDYYWYDEKMGQCMLSVALSYNLTQLRSLSVHLRMRSEGTMNHIIPYLSSLLHTARNTTYLDISVHLLHEPRSNFFAAYLHANAQPLYMQLESLTLGGNLFFAARNLPGGLSNFKRLRRLVAHTKDIYYLRENRQFTPASSTAVPYICLYFELPPMLEELVIWNEQKHFRHPEGEIVPPGLPNLRTLEFHLGVERWGHVQGKQRKRVDADGWRERGVDVGLFPAELRIEAFEYSSY